MSVDTDYAAYFLASPSSVIHLETVEITHPNFTRDYFLVRNARRGLTATLETAEVVDFEYYPLRIRPSSSSDDLEQTMRFDLGDLGDTLPREIDAINEAGGMGIKPAVRYRAYRSDDLSAPLFGPLELEIVTLASTKEGVSFEARAPSLNSKRTGEIYRIERFPMLRGFLS